jgi:hypothetical protein
MQPRRCGSPPCSRPRRTDAHGTHEEPRTEAVIWLNETQLGARHSVQFFRLYKPEGAEHWQNTTSFNRDDLPLVAKLADLAMMFIYGSVQSEGI